MKKVFQCRYACRPLCMIKILYGGGTESYKAYVAY